MVDWIAVDDASGHPDYLFADENADTYYQYGEERIHWAAVTNGAGKLLFKFADINGNNLQDSGELVFDINSDADTLTKAQEDAIGTDLTNSDTDADGLRDDDEAVTLGGSANGYNPLNWKSTVSKA